MIFFCTDLIGHQIVVKDTFLARLVAHMGDGWKEKPLSYI